MRSPRCSADNLAGMKFYGQCGAPLGVPFPSCGSGNPPEHRFCGQCGAPLDRPGLQEAVDGAVLRHRRVYSSHRTARGRGDARPRQLVSRGRLAEVHRDGGTAPQFTRGGFMALFGAPITQEDHVRSAAGGHRRSRESNRTTRKTPARPCRVARPVISGSARARPTQWIFPY